MVQCPWCGTEVPTEEYFKHYDTCEKRPLHYGVMKESARPIPGETVETINIPLLLGSDFKVTYQGPYQVNFDHLPTGVHLAILRKAGPHRHLPTSYRVWLYKGLTQMRRDVSSLEGAVDEIRKIDVAKEFTEPQHSAEEEKVKPLNKEEEEICVDIIAKLKETNQIYIVGHDVPISISKGLFILLDELRKKMAEKKGVPEIQYEWEDFLWDLTH